MNDENKDLPIMDFIIPKTKDDIIICIIFLSIIYFFVAGTSVEYIIKNNIKDSTITIQGDFNISYNKVYGGRNTDSANIIIHDKKYTFPCVKKNKSEICKIIFSYHVKRENKIENCESGSLEFLAVEKHNSKKRKYIYGYPIKILCDNQKIILGETNIQNKFKIHFVYKIIANIASFSFYIWIFIVFIQFIFLFFIKENNHG